MFDVGFSELLVIAVVALLVLGPERLPKAARFAGLWVRRARSQWNSVKAEFERDLADEDLKRSLRETQASLREAHASLRDAGSNMQREMEDARDSVMRGPMPPAAIAIASEQLPGAAITPTADPMPAPAALDIHDGAHDHAMYEAQPDPPPLKDDELPER